MLCYLQIFIFPQSVFLCEQPWPCPFSHHQWSFHTNLIRIQNIFISKSCGNLENRIQVIKMLSSLFVHDLEKVSQSYQDQVNCLPCPNDITKQVWSESKVWMFKWVKRHGADKQLLCTAEILSNPETLKVKVTKTYCSALSKWFIHNL